MNTQILLKKEEGDGIMKFHKYCLVASIFVTFALIFTGQALAGDIDAKLPDSDNTSSFQVKDSADNVLMKVQSGGDVGIGTSSPETKLELNGKLRLSSGESSYSSIYNVFVSGQYEGLWLRAKSDAVSPGNNGAGINLYADSDPQFPGGILLFTGGATRIAVDSTGNVGLSMTNQNSGGGAGVLLLGNAATNPTSALTNAAALYASGGELFSYDVDGNATQISPHDPETGEWIFYSKNTRTGKVVRVNMEKLVKKIEELTGEQFMEEWIEEVRK